MKGVCVIPPRIEALTEPQREHARLRYVLLLAAVWYSRSGTLAELAEDCGYNKGLFSTCMTRGEVTPDIALALEKTLGREHWPRELFCPRLALPAEA